MTSETQAPERIWAWYFIPEKQDDIIKGGSDDAPDRKATEYTRSDLVAAKDARIAELKGARDKVWSGLWCIAVRLAYCPDRLAGW